LFRRDFGCIVMRMVRDRCCWLVVASLLICLPGCDSGPEPPKSRKPAKIAADESSSDAAASEPSAKAAASSVPPEKVPAPLTDAKALAEEFGAQPGALDYGKKAGPDGVLTSVEGGVQVRRVGEEDFIPVKAQTPIFAGDQVRTDPAGTATLTLLDDSVVQIASDSALELGDRDATADPTSSAAVLFGAARFTVSARAPGEGAFLVFAPGAVVASAKASVHAVGVAADGDARVGVETGEVLLAGVKQLDKPITVNAGKAVDVWVNGDLAAPGELKPEEWGDWRVQAEAEGTARALAKAHLDALGNLETELDDAYADLSTSSEAALAADASAKALLKAKDDKGYGKAAPEYGATIEAAYLAALRLEQLTLATQAHAFLAEELYLRHPDEVQPAYAPVEARVHGAVLLNKKFRIVVGQRLRPLRPAFYAHHPEGRAHASLVEAKVPSFYAKVRLKPLPAAAVRAQLHGPVFMPPRVLAKGKGARKVVVGLPKPSWRAKSSAKPAPFRGGGAWNAAGSGKLLAGVKATAPRVAVFGKLKPTPLASAKIAVRGEPILAARHLKLKAKPDDDHETPGGVSGALEKKAKEKPAKEAKKSKPKTGQ
jgi:FecR protein